ncbi:hypothetical protein DIPPA_22664 [Diplonema papillatum]|nr:hypothetical protein DIPPA_22664 [Diplonema papillatum]
MSKAREWQEYGEQVERDSEVSRQFDNILRAARGGYVSEADRGGGSTAWTVKSEDGRRRASGGGLDTSAKAHRQLAHVQQRLAKLTDTADGALRERRASARVRRGSHLPRRASDADTSTAGSPTASFHGSPLQPQPSPNQRSASIPDVPSVLEANSALRAELQAVRDEKDRLLSERSQDIKEMKDLLQTHLVRTPQELARPPSVYSDVYDRPSSLHASGKETDMTARLQDYTFPPDKGPNARRSSRPLGRPPSASGHSGSRQASPVPNATGGRAGSRFHYVEGDVLTPRSHASEPGVTRVVQSAVVTEGWPASSWGETSLHHDAAAAPWRSGAASDGPDTLSYRLAAAEARRDRVEEERLLLERRVLLGEEAARDDLLNAQVAKDALDRECADIRSRIETDHRRLVASPPLLRAELQAAQLERERLDRECSMLGDHVNTRMRAASPRLERASPAKPSPRSRGSLHDELLRARRSKEETEDECERLRVEVEDGKRFQAATPIDLKNEMRAAQTRRELLEDECRALEAKLQTERGRQTPQPVVARMQSDLRAAQGASFELEEECALLETRLALEESGASSPAPDPGALQTDLHAARAARAELEAECAALEKKLLGGISDRASPSRRASSLLRGSLGPEPDLAASGRSPLPRRRLSRTPRSSVQAPGDPLAASARAAALERECTGLEQKLAVGKGRITPLPEVRRLQDELFSAERKQADFEERSRLLEERLAAEARLAASPVPEVNRLQSAYRSAQIDREGVEEQCRKLQERLEKREKALGNISKLKSDLEYANHGVVELTRECSTLSEKVKKERLGGRQGSTSDILLLEKELQETQTAREKLERECASLEEHIDTERALFTPLPTGRSLDEAEAVADMRDALSTVKAQRDELNQECARLRKQLEEKHPVSAVAADLEAIRDLHSEAQRECIRLRSDLSLAQHHSAAPAAKLSAAASELEANSRSTHSMAGGVKDLVSAIEQKLARGEHDKLTVMPGSPRYSSERNESGQSDVSFELVSTRPDELKAALLAKEDLQEECARLKALLLQPPQQQQQQQPTVELVGALQAKEALAAECSELKQRLAAAERAAATASERSNLLVTETSARGSAPASSSNPASTHPLVPDSQTPKAQPSAVDRRSISRSPGESTASTLIRDIPPVRQYQPSQNAPRGVPADEAETQSRSHQSPSASSPQESLRAPPPSASPPAPGGLPSTPHGGDATSAVLDTHPRSCTPPQGANATSAVDMHAFQARPRTPPHGAAPRSPRPKTKSLLNSLRAARTPSASTSSEPAAGGAARPRRKKRSYPPPHEPGRRPQHAGPLRADEPGPQGTRGYPAYSDASAAAPAEWQPRDRSRGGSEGAWYKPVLQAGGSRPGFAGGYDVVEYVSSSRRDDESDARAYGVPAVSDSGRDAEWSRGGPYREKSDGSVASFGAHIRDSSLSARGGSTEPSSVARALLAQGPGRAAARNAETAVRTTAEAAPSPGETFNEREVGIYSLYAASSSPTPRKPSSLANHSSAPFGPDAAASGGAPGASRGVSQRLSFATDDDRSSFTDRFARLSAAEEAVPLHGASEGVVPGSDGKAAAHEPAANRHGLHTCELTLVRGGAGRGARAGDERCLVCDGGPSAPRNTAGSPSELRVRASSIEAPPPAVAALGKSPDSWFGVDPSHRREPSLRVKSSASIAAPAGHAYQPPRVAVDPSPPLRHDAIAPILLSNGDEEKPLSRILEAAASPSIGAEAPDFFPSHHKSILQVSSRSLRTASPPLPPARERHPGGAGVLLSPGRAQSESRVYSDGVFEHSAAYNDEDDEIFSMWALQGPSEEKTKRYVKELVQSGVLDESIKLHAVDGSSDSYCEGHSSANVSLSLNLHALETLGNRDLDMSGGTSARTGQLGARGNDVFDVFSASSAPPPCEALPASPVEGYDELIFPPSPTGTPPPFAECNEDGSADNPATETQAPSVASEKPAGGTPPRASGGRAEPNARPSTVRSWVSLKEAGEGQKGEADQKSADAEATRRKQRADGPAGRGEEPGEKEAPAPPSAADAEATRRKQRADGPAGRGEEPGGKEVPAPPSAAKATGKLNGPAALSSPEGTEDVEMPCQYFQLFSGDLKAAGEPGKPRGHADKALPFSWLTSAASLQTVTSDPRSNSTNSAEDAFFTQLAARTDSALFTPNDSHLTADAPHGSRRPSSVPSSRCVQRERSAWTDPDDAVPEKTVKQASGDRLRKRPFAIQLPLLAAGRAKGMAAAGSVLPPEAPTRSPVKSPAAAGGFGSPPVKGSGSPPPAAAQWAPRASFTAEPDAARKGRSRGLERLAPSDDSLGESGEQDPAAAARNEDEGTRPAARDPADNLASGGSGEYLGGGGAAPAFAEAVDGGILQRDTRKAADALESEDSATLHGDNAGQSAGRWNATEALDSSGHAAGGGRAEKSALLKKRETRRGEVPALRAVSLDSSMPGGTSGCPPRSPASPQTPVSPEALAALQALKEGRTSYTPQCIPASPYAAAAINALSFRSQRSALSLDGSYKLRSEDLLVSPDTALAGPQEPAEPPAELATVVRVHPISRNLRSSGGRTRGPADQLRQVASSSSSPGSPAVGADGEASSTQCPARDSQLAVSATDGSTVFTQQPRHEEVPQEVGRGWADAGASVHSADAGRLLSEADEQATTRSSIAAEGSDECGDKTERTETGGSSQGDDRSYGVQHSATLRQGDGAPAPSSSFSSGHDSAKRDRRGHRLADQQPPAVGDVMRQVQSDDTATVRRWPVQRKGLSLAQVSAAKASGAERPAPEGNGHGQRNAAASASKNTPTTATSTANGAKRNPANAKKQDENPALIALRAASGKGRPVGGRGSPGSPFAQKGSFLSGSPLSALLAGGQDKAGMRSAVRQRSSDTKSDDGRSVSFAAPGLRRAA